MSAPRLGIVGARRRRQGLGPFVARDLRAAGADVTCFVTTSEASRDEAASALQAIAGVAARGYTDLATLLSRESVDALAILSPSDTHGAALDAALAAGVHVLCEKPLVWGEPDLAQRARDITGAFERAGKLLWENCQWCYTLPAFERLHPGALRAPPRRFEMTLQPASAGLQSLADSMPHPLSLLQVLAPGAARLLDVRFETGEAGALTIRFVHRTQAHAVDTVVHLRPTRRQPRQASLVLDGLRAERLISGPGYRFHFADGERSVELPDPMTLLVADFVSALRAGAPPEPARAHLIAQRMQLLADLSAAHRTEAAA